MRTWLRSSIRERLLGFKDSCLDEPRASYTALSLSRFGMLVYSEHMSRVNREALDGMSFKSSSFLKKSLVSCM